MNNLKERIISDVEHENGLHLRYRKVGDWLQKHSVIILTLLCLAIVSGGIVFLVTKYSAVAAPGTSVAGANIGGQNALSIHNTIGQMEGNIQLTLSYQGKTAVANSNDLGISINIDKTTTQAMLTSQNWLNRLNVFGQHKIQLVASYNWPKLANFIDQAFPSLITSSAQNAGVVYDKTAERFVNQASVDGKVVDMSKMKSIIQGLVAQPRNAMTEVAIITAKPTVNNNAAQTATEYANQRLEQRINFQLNGRTIYYPDPIDIANSTAFTPNGNQLNVTFDPSKVRDFINTKVQSVIPSKPINGQEIVGADNATVLKVIQPGQSGQNINNVDDLTKQMMNALTNGNSANIAVTTTNATPSMSKTVAPNNHWIEANLSDWSVHLYDGTNQIWSTNQTSHGKSDTPTITGLFTVFSKVGGNDSSGASLSGQLSDRQNGGVPSIMSTVNPNSNPNGGVCMPNPGPNTPEGSPSSWLCNIHYVTYWGAGGYAFHEAWWLNPTGASPVNSGISHGCINMQKADAATVYNFAQIGTPVWVHS
ncbi:MAG: L,D-transpeptidase [Candidatus Nanoperiomorbaceae bacterium]